MKYRFVLNNKVIKENPVGWDEMRIHVNRDNDLKAVLNNLEANLTFTKDGYDYIKSLRDSQDNYCAEFKISIQCSIDGGQNYIERFRGLLFLADMKFNEFECSVKVKVTDDSFFGRIQTRSKNEIFLTGTKTVNAEDLTPTPIYSMQLFDPATGNDVPTLQPYGCFRVYEALKNLISFISDNLVDYESPLFGPGGDFEYLMMTTGYSIRQTGNAVTLSYNDFINHLPPVSFQKLFTELDHRFNLGMYVDNSGSKPKIIIDDWKELFRNPTTTTFPNLPNLETEIAAELIYSQVHLGGSKTYDKVAASFPERIRFLGFANEKFVIVGKCNTSNTLDLSYDFVSSSNAIEEILILSGTDDSFDKDWFLIDCKAGPGQLIAKKSNWLEPGSTIQFYNERLTNRAIAERYIGFIPNAIASYLGNGNDTFQASEPSLSFSVTPFASFVKVPFSNDTVLPNNDPNGNYDPLTSEYLVPASGVYGFRTTGTLRLYAAITNFHSFSLYLSRYDNGGGLILRQLLTTVNKFQTGGTDFPYDYVTSINANATDRIWVEAYFEPSDTSHFNSANILASRVFAAEAVANGGGVYQSSDPADYPILRSIFSTEIKDSQTNAIIQNPLSQIGFYIEASDPRSAWIDDVTINEFDGTISSKLLTSYHGSGVDFPPDIRFFQVISTLPDTPFTISRSDIYGKPISGADTSSKCFFFKSGIDVTFTIPSTHMGCNMLYINLIEFRADGTSPPPTQYPSGTATFRINPGSNYTIQLSYDLGQPGNTFPVVLPIVTPPAVSGDDGTINILCVTPNDPADYSFSWSTGATTQGITAPPGLYQCVVTNINPGTFDTNVLTFNIEIPVSTTGV